MCIFTIKFCDKFSANKLIIFDKDLNTHQLLTNHILFYVPKKQRQEIEMAKLGLSLELPIL